MASANSFGTDTDGGKLCCFQKNSDDEDVPDKSGTLGPFTVRCGTQFFCHKEHDIYKMSSQPRGHGLIIVNKDFEDEDMYRKRRGAEKDMEMLMGLLNGLGYKIEAHSNKKAKEMQEIIAKFAAKSEHRTMDSAFVALSSHGESGGRIVGVDGQCVRMKDILSEFNNEGCRDLMDKPKLFLVQACRGDLFDFGVKGNNAADGGNHSRPTWTDMAVAYSTMPDYVSLRNEQNGSWFIQAVARVFSEHACEKPLSALYQKVCREMEVFEWNGVKQTPNIDYQGWKNELYFNPGF